MRLLKEFREQRDGQWDRRVVSRGKGWGAGAWGCECEAPISGSGDHSVNLKALRAAWSAHFKCVVMIFFSEELLVQMRTRRLRLADCGFYKGVRLQTRAEGVGGSAVMVVMVHHGAWGGREDCYSEQRFCTPSARERFLP